MGSRKVDIYFNNEDKYPVRTVWKRTYLCIHCKEAKLKESEM